MFRKSDNDGASGGYLQSVSWIVTTPLQGIYNVTTQTASMALDKAVYRPVKVTTQVVGAAKERVYPSYVDEDYQRVAAEVRNSNQVVRQNVPPVIEVEPESPEVIDEGLSEYLQRCQSLKAKLISETESCSFVMLFDRSVAAMKAKKMAALDQLLASKSWPALKQNIESILASPDSEMISRGFFEHRTRDCLEDCLREANKHLAIPASPKMKK